MLCACVKVKKEDIVGIMLKSFANVVGKEEEDDSLFKTNELCLLNFSSLCCCFNLSVASEKQNEIEVAASSFCQNNRYNSNLKWSLLKGDEKMGLVG